MSSVAQQSSNPIDKVNSSSVSVVSFVRLWPWIMVAIAFISGFVAGSMFCASSIAGKMRQVTTDPQGHSGEVFGQLSQQLAITSDQSSVVQEIVVRHFENSEKIRQSNLPSVLAEFDRFQHELTEVLTEEQSQKWKQQATWIRQNCYGVDENF